jgi:hypothetical protein
MFVLGTVCDSCLTCTTCLDGIYVLSYVIFVHDFSKIHRTFLTIFLSLFRDISQVFQ